MFNFLKSRKSKHTHLFTNSLGRYYSLCLTEYANGFDYIKIYERKQCSCGYYEDIFIGSEQFTPRKFYPSSITEEKLFIKELEAKGIVKEYELNIQNNINAKRMYLEEDD